MGRRLGGSQGGDEGHGHEGDQGTAQNQGRRGEKLAAKVQLLNASVKGGTADASNHALKVKRDLEKELAGLSTKNRTLRSTLEREAYDTGQKHEVSSAAFHRQWTPRSSAHWVDEVVLRDWTDPSNPQPLDPQDEMRDMKENGAQNIPAAFTRYYEPLFAKKPIGTKIPGSKSKVLEGAQRRRPSPLSPPPHRCQVRR